MFEKTESIFTMTLSRWIKYEEDLEAERGEWGKPHVSSLTFHSLINLRLCIETGTFLLDIAVNDLPSLVHRVVEDLSEKDIINEELKEKVLRWEILILVKCSLRTFYIFAGYCCSVTSTFIHTRHSDLAWKGHCHKNLFRWASFLKSDICN